MEEEKTTTKPLIPDGTTYIAERRFRTQYSLTEVTIPDSVTYIGKEAFWGCTNLEKVTIGNKVISIEDSAFCNCTKLKEVSIGRKVTYIGDNAFSNCMGLTKIEMNESVTTICNHAFSNCVGLGMINLTKNITSIGECAFSGCVGLEKITIPNSVNSIGASAFDGCRGLNKVIIEDGNESLKIVQTSFSNCPIVSIYLGRNICAYKNNLYNDSSSTVYSPFIKMSTLTSLTIGNNIKLGNQIFEGCVRLSEINLKDTEPTLVFRYSNPGLRKDNCVLNVPIGCKEKYSQADYWKDFANINEVDFSKNEFDNEVCVESDIYESTIVIKGDNVPVSVYNRKGELIGHITIEGKKHLNIPLAKVFILKDDLEEDDS